MNILELSGWAWQIAIENVIGILSRQSSCIITFANGWQLAQSYALEHNIKFSLDGEII